MKWLIRRLGALLVLAVFISDRPPAAIAAENEPTSWTTRQGRHVHLITDLPDSPQWDQWVAAFDTAVARWVAYWQRDLSAIETWRVTAYVMADSDKFQRAGYLPSSLPPFEHGFQQRDRIWIHHQASDYYSRHLFLHEGSHALAWHLYGELGPPWFAEGTAEWLATHRWEPDSRRPAAVPQITVGIIPAAPSAASGWGRIDLVKQAMQRNQVPPFLSVMRLDGTAHRNVESYAWSWLAMVLLENYPEYQRLLHSQFPAPDRRSASDSPAASGASAASGGKGAASLSQLNRQLFATLRDDWDQLTARWSLLALDIDYGWQAGAHRFEWPRAQPPVLRQPVVMQLQTDRGWQVAPLRLTAGQSVSLTASGRYTLRAARVTADGQPERAWLSEPDGITIGHYRSRPLGQLVACMLPLESDPNARYLPPLSVVSIGASGPLTATVDCLLLLKINEPPGDYSDNHGELQVTITPRPMSLHGATQR